MTDPTTSALKADREAMLARIATLRNALQMQENAEEYHVNCEECGGEETPELCPQCFPLFDDARIERRAALTEIDAPLPVSPSDRTTP